MQNLGKLSEEEAQKSFIHRIMKLETFGQSFFSVTVSRSDMCMYCMFVCVRVRMYVCVYTCVYVYVCVCVYVYVHTHVCREYCKSWMWGVCMVFCYGYTLAWIHCHAVTVPGQQKNVHSLLIIMQL